jgi:ribonuclease P protein subunit POP4
MSRPKHIAYDLLERAQGDVAQSIFTENVLRKPLVLRPTTDDDQPVDARQARQRARDARAAATARRNRKPRPLTAKEQRELGLYRIPPQQHRWEIFEPLHRMWLGYVHEVLGIKSKNPQSVRVDAKTAGPLIAAVDMHGAVLTVVRCRCVGRVGVTGIVAKETRGTFEIVTRKNELKGKLFWARPRKPVKSLTR